MSELEIHTEVMCDFFTKYHIKGPWPFHPVFHHFTDVDRGDGHDHPFSFRSIILHGGYTEEIFNKETGGSRFERREVGDSFFIEATHIHKIVELHDGDC